MRIWVWACASLVACGSESAPPGSSFTTDASGSYETLCSANRDCESGYTCVSGICQLGSADGGTVVDDAATATGDGSVAGGSDASMGDGSSADAGPSDAELRDGSPNDAGPADSGSPDLGPPDLGPPDLGPPDLGPPDLGPPDLGPPDLGPPDLGPPDLGPPDLGPPDLGPPDLGPTDAGFPPLDLDGYTLENTEVASQSFTFPAIRIYPGEVIVIGRNADRAAFAAQWPSMPAGATYLNAQVTGSGAPIINGGEVWELRTPSGTLVDGPTVTGQSGFAYQRIGISPGSATSWSEVSDASATPGQTAVPSGSGLVISEWSDASGSGRYPYEMIEITYAP